MAGQLEYGSLLGSGLLWESVDMVIELDCEACVETKSTEAGSDGEGAVNVSAVVSFYRGLCIVGGGILCTTILGLRSALLSSCASSVPH